MLQEKQNNLSQKLDEFTAAAADSPLDKNAAWNKLELRLQKRQPHVKPVWYAAAACLALAISLPFFLQKENTELAKFSDRKIVPFVPVTNMASVEMPTIIEAKNIPAAKEDNTAALKKNTAQPLKNIPVVIPDSLPAPVMELIAIRDPQPDTMPAVVAVAPKTKIRVVHLNELDAEDQIASKNIAIIKAARKNASKAPKEEYAGAVRFRISLKN